MLKKIEKESANEPMFVHFNHIMPGSTGTGLCFVYNGLYKHTKGGAPFITLFMRDVNGIAIPGYIFNMESPLIAGKELSQVIGHIVKITWTENYLSGRGMTLILNKVSIRDDVSPDVYAKFVGSVKDGKEKMDYVESFLSESLGKKTSIAAMLQTISTPIYCQGRVGGLVDHYSKMVPILKSYKDSMSKEEFYQLIATFAVYIFVHGRYVRSCNNEGQVDALEFTNLSIADAMSLSKALGLGSGILEVVHMFFGFKPTNFYLRLVTRASESVRMADEELCVYRSLALNQEGGAGFGAIKRYIIEEGK